MTSTTRVGRLEFGRRYSLDIDPLVRRLTGIGSWNAHAAAGLSADVASLLGPLRGHGTARATRAFAPTYGATGTCPMDFTPAGHLAGLTGGEVSHQDFGPGLRTRPGGYQSHAPPHPEGR